MGEIICATAMESGYPVTAEAMALVTRAGIPRVEIPFIEDVIAYHDRHAAEEAAAVIAEAGVECRSVHLDFDVDYDISSLDEGIRRSTLDDMVYAVSIAPVLGARIAVIHGSNEPVSDNERPARIETLRESLRELCPAAGKAGVRLALELLPRSCLGNTTREALAIVEGFPSAEIGFCLDVNHINLREDPAKAVEMLGERIATFHISDNDGVDERHWFPFEGVIDWGAFMAAVRQTGYSGQFVFETGGSLESDVAAYLVEMRTRFDRLMALT